MEKNLRVLLLVVCVTLCASAQTLTPTPTDLSSVSEDTRCPLQPRTTSEHHLFSVPADLRPKSDKKARLISLLWQSLHNEATAIDGKKKATILDVRLEKEIKEISSELAK